MLSRVLLVAGVVFLSACGKSTEQKHEDIVSCSGFMMGVSFTGRLSNGTSVDAILNQNGINQQDVFFLITAGNTYSKEIDTAKATSLAQKGAVMGKNYAEKSDVEGITSYLKDCVSTYKDLAK